MKNGTLSQLWENFEALTFFNRVMDLFFKFLIFFVVLILGLWRIATREHQGNGERKLRMRTGEKLDTTLGDVVAALTEETVQLVPDEKLAHTLVAYMLADVLNNWRTISNTWH